MLYPHLFMHQIYGALLYSQLPVSLLSAVYIYGVIWLPSIQVPTIEHRPNLLYQPITKNSIIFSKSLWNVLVPGTGQE